MVHFFTGEVVFMRDNEIGAKKKPLRPLPQRLIGKKLTWPPTKFP